VADPQRLNQPDATRDEKHDHDGEGSKDRDDLGQVGLPSPVEGRNHARDCECCQSAPEQADHAVLAS